MATIKGENLRILLSEDIHTENPRCIAASTSCVCHAAAQIEEDTTKDTDDDWIHNQVVAINWDVQTESLVVDDDDEYYREGAVAADQLQVGRTYYIAFEKTIGAAGEKNRDIEPVGHHYYGNAILSDLQFTAANGDQSVARAQFTGVGPINDEYNPGT
jgi:hypothetical protein